MFCFRTLVIGNITPTDVDKVKNFAEANGEGPSLNNSTFVHVYEEAWLGNWIAVVNEYLLNGTTNGKPCPTGIVNGSVEPGHFQLDLNRFSEWMEDTGTERLTRENSQWLGAKSVVRVDPNNMELVYSVILTSKTSAKYRSRKMLNLLRVCQDEAFEGVYKSPFNLRVYTIGKDGRIHFRKI